MSQIVIKIVATIFFDITIIMVMKNLLKETLRGKFHKLAMWSVLHIVVMLMLYETNHFNMLIPFISCIIESIAMVDTFYIKESKSFLVCLLCVLTMTIPDIISTGITTMFTTFEIARNSILIMSIMSVINCIGTVLLFEIPPIKKFLAKTVSSEVTFKNRKMISYTIVIFFIVGLLYYFLANIYALKIEYIVTSMAVVIFVALSFVYSKERSEYDLLIAEYNVLYECVSEFEEWTESAQLNIHEYKNQVAKILAVTEDKKVLKIVNKIIKNTTKVDADMIEQLKDLPKGGIKGLLYYKMITAKNKKIQLTIEIGQGVRNKFKMLKEQEVEDLTKLIGIYLDNAIEAVEGTNENKVNVEIYTLKGSLHFVFSNPLTQSIEIDKMYEKGKSSKGKERGNGLYFAMKIIKQNPRFQEEHRQINNFYIQKISITDC